MWNRWSLPALLSLLGLCVSSTTAGSSELTVLCHGQCLLCLQSRGLMILTLVSSLWLLIWKRRNLCFAELSSGLFSKYTCISLQHKKKLLSSERWAGCSKSGFELPLRCGDYRTKTCQCREVVAPAIPASPRLVPAAVTICGILYWWFLSIGKEIELEERKEDLERLYVWDITEHRNRLLICS